MAEPKAQGPSHTIGTRLFLSGVEFINRVKDRHGGNIRDEPKARVKESTGRGSHCMAITTFSFTVNRLAMNPFLDSFHDLCFQVP